jgi:3-hydroxybutyryl-CoA dehydrogenase
MSEFQGLRVTVAGLGPMGRGIARVFDQAGATVTVADISEEAAANGLEEIRQEAQQDGETSKVVTAPDVRTAVADADVFIEAIVESMDAKRELLRAVAAAGKPDLLVASNTSSLSVGEMGRAFGDPSRVVGMHFFNPATKMRLVEVVVGAATADDVVARAVELVVGLGKTPVVCKDSPNFVVNRVCRPLYYEAELLVSQGVEPAVVDSIARGALGHRMGPLQLLDFTGLHTHLASSETALREFGDPRYRPIPHVRGLVRNGMTGRAAGRGFYDYEREKPKDAAERVVRAPGETTELAVAITGPDADSLSGLPEYAANDVERSDIVVYRCLRPPTAEDADAIRSLARTSEVVLDSSAGEWLEQLSPGIGWLRIHSSPRGSLFAEVVEDEPAGIAVTPAVMAVVDALGAVSVRVLALPGLVADRLLHCLINEASVVVEEETASRRDVDVALKLAMNHPLGPFEHLDEAGVVFIHASLRSMTGTTGDPRYRPSQLLRRLAAAAARS